MTSTLITAANSRAASSFPVALRIDTSISSQPQLAVPFGPRQDSAMRAHGATDVLKPDSQGIGMRQPATIEPRFPANLCYDGKCSVEMKRIWEEFKAAGPIDTETLPHVYSGSTYHRGFGQNPEIEHFSGFLLDPVDGGIAFNGQLAFFFQENPYAELTVEQAREKWQGQIRKLTLNDDHAYINLNPGGTWPVEYWLRKAPDSDKLLLVGFFGGGRFAVAELLVNQP